MGNWRDHLRLGRRDVHREMCVPAVYIARTGSWPVRVNVRVHARPAVLNPQNVGPGLAGMIDATPHLIFERCEVANPLRNAIVAVSECEIYRLDVSRIPDGDYIKVNCNQIPEAECVAIWKSGWRGMLL